MTTTLIPVYITIFLFGIVIGSFCNVCIYRIPKKETVVTTPSHCMNCGYQLKWYDLIPILSWVLLGGKCRTCGQKISVQYPLIETLNGVLYVLIFVVNDFNLIYSILCCLLTSALVVLSVIDARTFEIPLGINIFILVMGALRVATDLDHWHDYVIGFVVVSGILQMILWITKGRAIGGGDVKLMAAAGLFLGWKCILLAFVLGCVLGAILHVIRMEFFGADRRLAFGPYLSLGIFLSMLWGEQMINWYIHTVLYCL